MTLCGLTSVTGKMEWLFTAGGERLKQVFPRGGSMEFIGDIDKKGFDGMMRVKA